MLTSLRKSCSLLVSYLNNIHNNLEHYVTSNNQFFSILLLFFIFHKINVFLDFEKCSRSSVYIVKEFWPIICGKFKKTNSTSLLTHCLQKLSFVFVTFLNWILHFYLILICSKTLLLFQNYHSFYFHCWINFIFVYKYVTQY